jgi:hypothetical protein
MTLSSVYRWAILSGPTCLDNAAVGTEVPGVKQRKTLREPGTNWLPKLGKQAVKSNRINLSNPAIAPYMAFNPC